MSESKGSDSGGKLQEKWDEHIAHFHARNVDGMGTIFADDVCFLSHIHGSPAPTKIEGKEGVVEFLHGRFGMMPEGVSFSFEDQTIVDEENMKTVLLKIFVDFLSSSFILLFKKK